MSEYNICSLLVHCQTEKIAQVQIALEHQSGTEIHASTEDSRLIVTLEADNRKIIAQQILDIQKIEGVLSAAMIYQFSDDLEDTGPTEISTHKNNEFESVQKRMSA